MANGLTAEQERKLLKLKNCHTRYELVLTNGTQRYRVCYSAQHSRRGIIAGTRENYDAVIEITGGAAPFVAEPSDVFHGNEWRVLFSGRTQRACILDDELVWVGSAYKEEVKKVYAEAWCRPSGDVLCVPFKIWSDSDFGECLGHGNTGVGAWKDAYQRLMERNGKVA
jgi:hypothetical protein